MYKVYMILNKVSMSAYVGMTKQKLTKRFSQHKCYARTGHKSPLYDAMRKYGSDAFVIIVMSQHGTREECCQAEIDMITLCRTLGKLYNLHPGGEGGFDNTTKPSVEVEEWKAKLKASRKGKTPSLGMQHTETTKLKCKLAAKAYWDKQTTYGEEVTKLSYLEANSQYGISKTHYYRLRKSRARSNDLS